MEGPRQHNCPIIDKTIVGYNENACKKKDNHVPSPLAGYDQLQHVQILYIRCMIGYFS